MRAILSPATVLLLLSAACGSPADDPGDDGEPGQTSVIIGSAVAADSQKVDKVASVDGVIKTDGRNDAAFDVVVAGPLKSLSLILTDANGTAKSNQIWDSNVGESPVAKVGVTFTRGSSTWQVGVYEGAALLNLTDGSLPTLTGMHEITLYAANSGYFKAGSYFRFVLERPDGTLAYGPVFEYPAQ